MEIAEELDPPHHFQPLGVAAKPAVPAADPVPALTPEPKTMSEINKARVTSAPKTGMAYAKHAAPADEEEPAHHHAKHHASKKKK